MKLFFSKHGLKILFALVLALMLQYIVRRALGGPTNVPNENDVKKATREAKAMGGGSDFRAKKPEGAWVGGNGIIEPAQREIKLAAQVPGVVQEIFVQEGQRVKADAPLVQLTAEIEKANWWAAGAELQAARARAELSKSIASRVEQLHKKGAATLDEWDRAQRAAQADAAAVKASEARAGQAKVALDRMTVKAPYAGEILAIKFRPGEFYNPAGVGTDPLLIFGNTEQLRARLDIDERDIAKVKKGAKAFVTADAYGEERFEGKVVELGHRMGRKNIRTDDPVERIDTKILEVVLELERADRLLPGLRVVGYVESSK